MVVGTKEPTTNYAQRIGVSHTYGGRCCFITILKVMTDTKNEILTPEVFQFSSTKQEVRSLVVENEPWLVAKDVCDILGLTNHKVAVKSLDEDEVRKTYLLSNGGNQLTTIINESGLYTLIMRSNKPEAKTFRKWVTSEVLPAIRKRGYYGTQKKSNDFIDCRDVPFRFKEFNGINIRYIELDSELWFSLNDIHTAIGSRTESTQAARKLNQKQTLAKKVWLFGNTHPAWFTNNLGLQLLVSGSRTLNQTRQLELNFGGQA